MQQSQANYTHTLICFFAFQRPKKLHLVLWVPPFSPQVAHAKNHSPKSRLKTSQKEAPLLPSKVSQRFKRSIVGRAPPFHGGSFSWWNLTPNIWGWKTFFRHLINFTQKKVNFVNKCSFPQNYGNLRDSWWLPHRNK